MGARRHRQVRLNLAKGLASRAAGWPRVSTCTAAAMAVAAITTTWWAHHEGVLLTQLKSTVMEAQVTATTHADGAATGAGDFTQTLRPARDADALGLSMVEGLSAVSTCNGVVLLRSQVQRVNTEPPMSAAMLPKMELSFALRGSYPALKMAIHEAQQRVQPAVLRELSLQRSDSPEGQVMAQGILVVPLRPESPVPGRSGVAR